MPSLSFKFVSSKNGGLVISPTEVLDTFLYGINIKTIEGYSMSPDTIKGFILNAQQQIEKFLGIKLIKQIVQENRWYDRSDSNPYLYLRTTFPVRKALDVDGYIGEQPQLNYHPSWLVTKKSNTGQYYRQISILPNAGANSPVEATFTGRAFLGASMVIPEYWLMTYITGFEPGELPMDLLNLIGKMAAVDILNIWGNSIIGPGLTGTTLSIDGLSQSIQTSKQNAKGAFGSTITQYLEDIQKGIQLQKSYYKGITMSVC